eukprot:Em0017g127a
MMAAAAVETPVATIPEIVRKVRDGFNSRKTLDKAFRTEQLRGLQRMMQECRDRIGQALKTDLDKCGMEIFMTECNHCEVEVSDAIKQLGHWMAPESVSKGLVNMMNSVFVEPEPYGVVLVIAPWNYPFSLVVLPLIGAIAAGNACIIKPSELSAATSNLFCELLPQYLDHDCYSVISGGVDVSQAVLKERFDYIFYTGSTPVGKLVMKQAAENLTPVTLELGGKSPCIIANDAAIEVAAKRLVWGKCINSGQTCIAPDYVICPRDKQAVLVERCKEAIREFYGEDPRLSPDYGKVINQRHFNRLMSLIRSTRGNVVFGGDTDEQKLKINPTLITDVTPGDPIMEDEIFGPILPFVPVDSVDEAINLVNSRYEDPKGNKDYGKIINRRHFDRLMSLIRSTRGNVVFGGDADEQKLKINPTLITDVTPGDSTMQEEIFGPILPIIAINNMEEAIEIINSMKAGRYFSRNRGTFFYVLSTSSLEKPLAMYVFSESKRTLNRVIRETSAGGVCHNDTLMHAGAGTLPFGGVGHSGLGAYHGKFSFDTFTHQKPVLSTSTGLEVVNKLVRYPPWTQRKLQILGWVLSPSQKRISFWPYLCLVLLVAGMALAVQTYGFPSWLYKLKPN